MKIFLAGTRTCAEVRKQSLFCLDSFFELDPRKKSDHLQFKDYLLDSGAFTFMNTGKKVDWNEYVEKYAHYVKTNGIKHYFELDIDTIIGYDAVLKIRKRLESLVGWQCIPVWHINRGKEAFKQMVRDYKYVALGGFAGSIKVVKLMQSYFRVFIDEAHRNGCKIHGLGYTSLENLPHVHFDSVDSTTWLSGARYGTMFGFNGSGFFVRQGGHGKVNVLKSKERNLLNGLEWIKF